MRHKLDLFANAIDSLNEGLRQYRDALEGHVRSYKFAVLHFAHFTELLFKHVVAREHPLLIYKNPGSRTIETENTIGLHEALAILANANYTIHPDLLRDVRWLKALRNKIEHCAVEMDVIEVRSVLGRIIRASNTFSLQARLTPIVANLAEEERDTFERLLDEYEEKLANARADAAAEGEQLTMRCLLCGEDDTAIEREDRIDCYFCGEVNILIECAVCCERHPQSEMTVWNDDDPSQITWASVYCEEIYTRD